MGATEYPILQPTIYLPWVGSVIDLPGWRAASRRLGREQGILMSPGCMREREAHQKPNLGTSSLYEASTLNWNIPRGTARTSSELMFRRVDRANDWFSLKV